MPPGTPPPIIPSPGDDIIPGIIIPGGGIGYWFGEGIAAVEPIPPYGDGNEGIMLLGGYWLGGGIVVEPIPPYGDGKEDVPIIAGFNDAGRDE